MSITEERLERAFSPLLSLRDQMLARVEQGEVEHIPFDVYINFNKRVKRIADFRMNEIVDAEKLELALAQYCSMLEVWGQVVHALTPELFKEMGGVFARRLDYRQLGGLGKPRRTGFAMVPSTYDPPKKINKLWVVCRTHNFAEVAFNQVILNNRAFSNYRPSLLFQGDGKRYFISLPWEMATTLPAKQFGQHGVLTREYVNGMLEDWQRYVDFKDEHTVEQYQMPPDNQRGNLLAQLSHSMSYAAANFRLAKHTLENIAVALAVQEQPEAAEMTGPCDRPAVTVQLSDMVSVYFGPSLYFRIRPNQISYEHPMVHRLVDHILAPPLGVHREVRRAFL